MAKDPGLIEDMGNDQRVTELARDFMR